MNPRSTTTLAASMLSLGLFAAPPVNAKNSLLNGEFA
jgi:hypothetical protein